MTSATGPRGLTSLAWDGAGRMVAATSAGGSETTQAAYAYDHTGRMLSREESAGSTTSASIFLPFALTQETAAIYDPAGGGDEGTLTYSFICDPSGIRLSQTDHAQDPAETAYPFRSPRGDVLALAGQDGSLAQTYAYEPYGEMEEEYTSEGTPFLFQDDYLDPATDLYQMQARWYDPQAALFTSQDPAMGDATDPTLRYPYAYCAGDPVYNSDPSGERLVEGEGEGGRLITWAPTSALKKYAARRGIRPAGKDGSTSFTKLYGRDEAGRMTSLSVQDAAAPGGAAPLRDITYSHLGVPLRVVSHPSDNPTEDITVSYAWDAGSPAVQTAG